MIMFNNVSKAYKDGTKALKDVNLQIDDGEFVFIIGQSGAGKSTIVKLLMAEEKISAGEITVGNYKLSTIKRRQIPYLRRTLGVVFQDFRLIPTKTVFENIAFAMRAIGKNGMEVNKRVKYILNLVGLTHKAGSYPRQISGGEQQRVALARALVNNPKVIIADEPTGNIDPEMSNEIMELLAAINEQGITVVVVTHEKSLVDRFNKRVVTIDNGMVVSDRTGGYSI